MLTDKELYALIEYHARDISGRACWMVDEEKNVEALREAARKILKHCDDIAGGDA